MVAGCAICFQLPIHRGFTFSGATCEPTNRSRQDFSVFSWVLLFACDVDVTLVLWSVEQQANKR